MKDNANSLPMLKAAGLWAKTSVKGGQYLTGRLGGVKVLIMENRDRQTDDDPSHHLFFTEAPDQRHVVPLPVIDTGGAVAKKPKPVGAGLLVDKPRRTRRLQRLDEVGKRHGPGRMELGHLLTSAGKLARPKRFELLTF